RLFSAICRNSQWWISVNLPPRGSSRKIFANICKLRCTAGCRLPNAKPLRNLNQRAGNHFCSRRIRIVPRKNRTEGKENASLAETADQRIPTAMLEKKAPTAYRFAGL